MGYPDSFDSQTTKINGEMLSSAAQQDLDELENKGYEVHLGLTPEIADDIAKMALEPSIKEYCPRDCAERFKDRDSTKAWLSKKRATFLLLKKSDGGDLRLIGYGWAGAATSKEVPEGETTFAIRIGEVGQGQGLATPFARLIVEATKVLFEAKDMWLETWQSNGGAVHIYHKIGFEDVAQLDDQRISTSGDKIADKRLFMKLPQIPA